MFDPNEYEPESAENLTSEQVYMLKNGEALELSVPDDDGEEDHDNVDYD